MKQILIIIGILFMVGNISATTHTVCVSGCDFTEIQAAVTAASSYDTVYVYNGTYTENINIPTAHLTVEGEGRDVVTVNAADVGDHVFEVTANYVNISGFTVGECMGDYLGGIYTNAAYGTFFSNMLVNTQNGIYLDTSNNNNINNNIIISSIDYGVNTLYSNNNKITNNNVSLSGMDGIYIYNSDNTNINGNSVASNTGQGIHFRTSHNNNVSNNSATSNNENGFYLRDFNNNDVSNNSATSNNENGFYLRDIDNTDVSNNSATSNHGHGFNILLSNYNNFSNNSATSNNKNGFRMYNSNNNYTNNAESHNWQPSSYFQSDLQNEINSQINFNFTMRTINNTECPTCTYNLDLYPHETSLQSSPVGCVVSGSFVPTKSGIYSLQITVMNDTNSEIQKYVHIINPSSTTIDYYFRHVIATHGQPVSYGTDHDAGTLLLVPPNTNEEVWCSHSLGLSVDVLPDYLFGIIENVNYSIWYSVSSGGKTGIQRYANRTSLYDYGYDILELSGFNTFSYLDLYWASDYSQKWYWLSVGNSGILPYIYSNATHPSYANITYLYSNTPAIKSITNEDILLLSATSPATDNTSASIVLDGIGTTNLTVQMPNTTLTYTATYDGSPCNDALCSFTQNAGELNFSLVLGSEHVIEILSLTNNEISENPFQAIIFIIDGIVSIINSLISFILVTFPVIIALAILSGLFILITKIMKFKK